MEEKSLQKFKYIIQKTFLIKNLNNRYIFTHLKKEILIIYESSTFYITMLNNPNMKIQCALLK